MNTVKEIEATLYIADTPVGAGSLATKIFKAFKESDTAKINVIYQDSNYEQETTVRVVEAGYNLQIELYDGLEIDSSRLVGKQGFCRSARQACVERARRIVIGKPLPGEVSPAFV